MFRRFLSVIALLCLALVPVAAAAAEEPKTREVVDSDGKSVVVPYEVTRVAPVIPAFAQVTEMLTRGGGKIVAYPIQGVGDYFKRVFPDIVAGNPSRYASDSVEDLIASGAQVVYGPMTLLSDDQRAQLDKAGIAVVAVNGIYTVDQMCRSFLTIGRILGEAETARAEEFVRYYRGNMDEAARRTAHLAEKDRVRMLVVSIGGGTFSTINRGDIGHEYLIAAGGINVAADYLAGSRQALVVDPELIVTWDPQFIMATSRNARDELLNSPGLADVRAVRDKKIFICPYGIFQWSVRSGEGAMLPLWLGTVMYPDLFADVDMKKVVRDFFRDFYNYSTTPEEEVRILGGPDNFTPASHYQAVNPGGGQ